MIGFAKKKRASIAGGAETPRSGSARRGSVLGMNLNSGVVDSQSSMSSRSGMNSARGHHAPISLLQNPVI